MARCFEGAMSDLANKSGYPYDFLVDRYNEMVDDGEYDWDYFVGVTMEHDWWIKEIPVSAELQETMLRTRSSRLSISFYETGYQASVLPISNQCRLS